MINFKNIDNAKLQAQSEASTAHLKQEIENEDQSQAQSDQSDQATRKSQTLTHKTELIEHLKPKAHRHQVSKSNDDEVLYREYDLPFNYTKTDFDNTAKDEVCAVCALFVYVLSNFVCFNLSCVVFVNDSGMVH